MLLVDPQQVQKIKGRPQSDVHDCQWLQRLHTFGLLAGAFRPPDHVCVLRSYLRQRAMLLSYASQHIQHMHKALTQMNLKLQHVVSDVTGETGMAIIRAILAGERDPAQLARLRNYRCHHDEETIAKALHGQGREEHLCALAQAVALYDMDHERSSRVTARSQPPWRRSPNARTGTRCPRCHGRASGRATARIGTCVARGIGSRGST